MRNKILVTMGILVLVLGLFTGMVFAIEGTDSDEDQSEIQSSSDVEIGKFNERWNLNSANNINSETYRDMLNIMRTNGFATCSRFMQTGNYQRMDEWMDGLFQEDFDTMKALMEETGYSGMAEMMDSFGLDGMINMHNSTNGIRGRGMMGY